MLVDVVQINAASAPTYLRKVLQFVCGNTLVCETIKQARSVAFDGEMRHKVRFNLGHGQNATHFIKLNY